MSKRKVHIDELFRNGLRSLRLLVSDKDFEAIDKKTGQLSDDLKDSEKNLFDDFELSVTDSDWLATKSKLELGKSGLSDRSVFGESLGQLSIDPEPEDWERTMHKLQLAKRRRVAIYWWLGTGVLLLFMAMFGLMFNKQSEESGVTQETPTVPLTQENPVANGESTDSQWNQQNKSQSESNTENIKANINDQKVNTVDKKGMVSGSSTGWRNGFGQNNKTTESKKPTTGIEGSDLGPDVSAEGTNIKHHPLEANSSEHPETENKETVNSEDKNLVQTAEKIKKVKPKTDPEDSLRKVKDSLDKVKYFTPVAYLALVNQIDYTRSFLSGRNSSQYNAIRKSSDQPVIQYTTGFEAAIVKGSHWSFNTGLQYTSLNFTSVYDYKYRICDSIKVYVGGQYIGFFPKNWRDTAMNSTETVNISKVQLPLGVSYCSGFGKGFAWHVGLSGVLTMNTSASGSKMINPENIQLYNYSALKQYERVFNVMPQLRLGVNYRFHPRWMLEGAASGSMMLLSRFKNEFGSGDYLCSGGINLKLIYLIKKQQ